MFTKYATVTIERVEQITPEVALSSEANMERFRQLTAQVKRVAPRSDEFTYFVCRAIHAMEAANYDPTTKQFSGDGHIVRCGKDGKCERCGTNVEDWQHGLWHSASGIDPYLNQNGDAFPEDELLKTVVVDGEEKKAYETFIGRGLFVNHASDDAEKIRGIILDASWDPSTKGVDILVACDKVAYPELARQIQMGYSNDVSMGTQVQYSLCSVCGNKAVTEDDYCEHVKASKGLAQTAGQKVYEINNGLNFIEISVVSNGADPRAKIKTVLAHLNHAVQEREGRLNSCINPIEAEKIRDEIRTIQAQLKEILGADCTCGNSPTDECQCDECQCDDDECQCDDDECQCDEESNVTSDAAVRIRARHKLASELGISISNDEGDEEHTSVPDDDVNIKEGETKMTKKPDKKAYFQGGGGLNDPEVTPYEKEDYVKVRDNEDKQMVGQGMEPGNTGMHPGYGMGSDESVKQELHRASVEERRQARHALLQKAYFQGGGGLNDPEVTPYEKEDYVKVRDNEDKQMVGQGMEPGNTGMHPGYGMGPDQKVKEELHRAKLRARFVTADTPARSSWTLYAGTTPILTATAEELYEDELEKPNEDNPEITNWQWVASESYGKNLIKAVKELGFDAVKAQIKKAQELPLGEEPTDLELPEEPAGEHTEELPPEGGEGEMTSEEQIMSALDKIRSAVAEIEALNQGEGATTETLENEVELGDAERELENMKEPLAAAKGKSVLKKIAVVVSEAVEDAEKLVAKANKLIDAAKAPTSPKIKKVAEEEEDEEDEEGERKEEPKTDLDAAEADIDDAEEELEDAEHELEEEEEKKASVNLETRKAARRKVAQELYNLTDGDMIAEAHPQGGTDTKAGDAEKLEGDAHVETKTEAQEADMEVTEKEPRGELVARRESRRKVIEAMDDEDEKAKEGEKPDFADIDKDGNKEESAKEAAEDAKKKEEKKEASIKTAEVDSETKSYYTEMFSESATGNKADSACTSYAGELTQDYHAKKQTASINELKVRMKRAYKVALKQQKLGQITEGEQSLEQQVDRLTNLSSTDFEALEDVIENTEVVKDAQVKRPITRSAGALQVGRTEPGDNEEFDALKRFNWR